MGVLQFLNKIHDMEFTYEDEKLVEQFAAYIGLALHHAKLYDKIRKNENKTSVSYLIFWKF